MFESTLSILSSFYHRDQGHLFAHTLSILHGHDMMFTE